MGCLMDRHGVILVGRTPEGACPMCATEHEPGLPHNLQSLAYQYKFYDEHGRWPTWEDAMAHCEPQVQEHWRQAMAELGIGAS